MEIQKPKVAMYAKRSFGDKLNASFDFIKENWKPLLKYSTYLILPVCLLQALSLNGLIARMIDLNQITAHALAGGMDFSALGIMFIVNYFGYIFLSIIGSLLLYCLIYALIRIYNESDERLQGITFAVLKPLLFHNLGRMLKLFLCCIVLTFLVIFVVTVFVFLTPFTLILIIPVLVAFSVPLVLLTPIYLFENISIIDAFKKTFRLGFATWGGVFAVSFVMSLVGGVLQGVTMVPWYIATLVKYFFVLSNTGGEVTVSAGYSFILYLLGIVQAYGAYMSMIFAIIGLAYQYGHASEVMDSVTVENDIDNFDKL